MLRRDYGPMIEAAQIVLLYDGFLTIDDKKHKGEAQTSFQLRCAAFVDDLLTSSDSWWALRDLHGEDRIGGATVSKVDALCSIIDRDLVAIETSNSGYVNAIDMVRDTVITKVRRDAHKSVVRRKVERVLPYFLCAVFVAASVLFLYCHFVLGWFAS